MHITHAFFYVVVTVVGLFSGVQAEILYRVNFEDGTIGEGGIETEGGADPGGAFAVVDNPSRDSSNPSAMAGYASMAQGYVRAEFRSPRFETEGKTYVYQWSYFLPEDFFQGADFNDLLFTQWKTFPCKKGTHGSEICGSGGIFNDIHNVNDGNEMDMRWRAQPDCDTYRLDVQQGRWWYFQQEIYWTNSSDGYYKLWIDGEVVKDVRNVKTLFDNFDPGSCEIYWTVGLYSRWQGSKDSVGLYVDDIAIHDTSGVEWLGREALIDPVNECTTSVCTTTVTLFAAVTVEEEVPSGSVDASSSDLGLGRDGDVEMLVGMTFSNLALPQGTQIDSAYIQFTADLPKSGPVTLNIYGDDTDDSGPFTEEDRNVSGRTATGAAVTWSPPDWTSTGEKSADQRTPDISSVIQVLIDRDGWVSGNNISIIITRDVSDDGTDKRLAAGSAVRLVLMYYHSNPAEVYGSLTRAGGPLPSELIVYDLQGRLVFKGACGRGDEWALAAEFSRSGVYLVKFTGTDGSEIRKIWLESR